MKKTALWTLALILGITTTHALQISEIMSNPTGDDSGREWMELYNDTSAPIDLSALSISIKGGTPDAVTPVSGGTTIAPNGYAIIGAVVGGQTKFSQDYPGFTGPLLKSSITLVNTGSASLDIRLDGAVVDTLNPYIPAKEGKTLSRINGSMQSGTPTPGESNQSFVDTTPVTHSTQQSNSQSSGQVSPQITQQVLTTNNDKQVSLPSVNDIVIYLPTEKIVIAGAETEFVAKSSNHNGKVLPNALYTWAYGDGGQGTGSTTKYVYAYTGRYVAEVEVTTESGQATGRMLVKVVSPDIAITNVGRDGRGVYVDITNPSQYEVNLSQWKLIFDGATFPFPKNTLLLASSTTRFSGSAMGFGTLIISSSTVIKILFPHLEEVTRYAKRTNEVTLPNPIVPTLSSVTKPAFKSPYKTQVIKKSDTSIHSATTSQLKSTSTRVSPKVSQIRDTRVVSWVKGLLGSR